MLIENGIHGDNTQNTQENEMKCGRVGYAYVPSQAYGGQYMPEEALLHGTLFEALYKPFGVYGCESCQKGRDEAK